MLPPKTLKINRVKSYNTLSPTTPLSSIPSTPINESLALNLKPVPKQVHKPVQTMQNYNQVQKPVSKHLASHLAGHQTNHQKQLASANKLKQQQQIQHNQQQNKIQLQKQQSNRRTSVLPRNESGNMENLETMENLLLGLKKVSDKDSFGNKNKSGKTELDGSSQANAQWSEKGQYKTVKIKRSKMAIFGQKMPKITLFSGILAV